MEWMKEALFRFKLTHQRMGMPLCQGQECPGGNRPFLTTLHKGSEDSLEIGLPERTPKTQLWCTRLNSEHVGVNLPQ